MEGRSYSRDIAHAIKNYLAEDQSLQLSFNEQFGVFTGYLRLDGLVQRINYEVYVDDDSYVILGTLPINADKSNKKVINALNTFSTHINSILTLGQFNIDESDGEIQYLFLVNCKKIIPSKVVIRDSIFIATVILDSYRPVILGIISGDYTTTEEVVERCRNIDKDLQTLGLSNPF